MGKTHHKAKEDAVETLKPAVDVRPMEISDFEFIQALAGKTNGFTSPSPYVLWMMMRVHGKFCAVAEVNGGQLVGYLLALPSTQRRTIFVWQLAITTTGRRSDAAIRLANYLKNLCSEADADTIVFTAVPNSPSDRLVASLSTTVFDVCPERVIALPRSVSVVEHEYRVRLKNAQGGG